MPAKPQVLTLFSAQTIDATSDHFRTDQLTTNTHQNTVLRLSGTLDGAIIDLQTLDPIISWDLATTYNLDDVVYYDLDNKFYKSLANGVTSKPTNATNWVEIANNDPLVNAYWVSSGDTIAVPSAQPVIFSSMVLRLAITGAGAGTNITTRLIFNNI